jgi:hypothetical protein
MMAPCSWEPLEALVMGELGPDEARAVRDHAARCGACAAELTLLMRETRAVQAWARADRNRARERRVRRATWVAAACVAMLALGRMHAGYAGGDVPGGRDGAGARDTSQDVAAIDEAWSACLTMTPASAPPASMSFAGEALRSDRVFSPRPPRACE